MGSNAAQNLRDFSFVLPAQVSLPLRGVTNELLGRAHVIPLQVGFGTLVALTELGNRPQELADL